MLKNKCPFTNDVKDLCTENYQDSVERNKKNKQTERLSCVPELEECILLNVHAPQSNIKIRSVKSL